MSVSAVSGLGPVHSPAPVANTLPKKSGSTELDAVLAGGTAWWHDSTNTAPVQGSDGMSDALHTLTYSFMATANSGSAQDNNGFQAMNTTEQQAVRDALAYVSSVADITFQEVASGGNIQFGTNNQGHKSSGYANYPNSTAANVASVYIANDAYDPNTTNWAAGTTAWQTLVHEIGHALGLKHPGPYNAGGGKTPGPYLPKAEDNTRYSVMSYNSPSNSRYGNSVQTSPGVYQLSVGSIVASGYEMVDVQALQYMYGASRGAQAAGAQQYAFAAADADHGRFMKTIFNTNSGSVIDASGEANRNVIDLRAGHFSSIGIHDPYAGLGSPFDTAKKFAQNARGVSKPTYDGTNNLGIAKGSHIDAAKAGTGGDTIVGNDDGTNTIDGGAGNDQIFLGRANSTITGGGGYDTVSLPTLAHGQKWTVSFDQATGTYTCTGGGITDRITNVAAIKTWNGRTLKASGKNLEVVA